MLNEHLLAQLRAYFDRRPSVRDGATPAAELVQAEQARGLPLPAHFKRVTAQFGGCLIGQAQICGLRNCALLGSPTLLDLNREFADFPQAPPGAWGGGGHRRMRQPRFHAP